MGQKVLTNKQLKEIELKVEQIIARSEAESISYNNQNDEAILDSYIQLLTQSRKQAQIKKLGLRVIG